MARKTKVRIVGDPYLSERIAAHIAEGFKIAKRNSFDRAVGRDYDHCNAGGITIYLEVKGPRGKTTELAFQKPDDFKPEIPFP